MHPSNLPALAPQMVFIGFFVFFVFFGIIAVLLIVIPFWQIFKKAGFPGALSLIMLIPLGNIIMSFFLAFSEWPALKDKRTTSHGTQDFTSH